MKDSAIERVPTRLSGLLAPARAVLDRLKYPQKFAAGDQFGIQRLLSTLAESRGLAESLATAWQSVEAWCEGERPHDDVTMLALEIANRSA